ncbi:hypothetical protein [Photobacterium damselae]|uniref:hypothetical protein n=1 Tax=Photobacterium damselae TaxID=38293 RepID=UPI004068C165
MSRENKLVQIVSWVVKVFGTFLTGYALTLYTAFCVLMHNQAKIEFSVLSLGIIYLLIATYFFVLVMVSKRSRTKGRATITVLPSSNDQAVDKNNLLAFKLSLAISIIYLNSTVLKIAGGIDNQVIMFITLAIGFVLSSIILFSKNKISKHQN